MDARCNDSVPKAKIMKKILVLIFSVSIAIFIVSCSSTKGGKDSNVNALEGYHARAVPDVEFTRFEKFDPNNFDEQSIVIDNEWFPMTPGVELIYFGYDIDDEGEKVDHRIVFTTTDLTKIIDGVNTVVLYERDYSDGELEEAELAFFAQDKDGNVWHFGQYYEIYEEGEFIGGRMWAQGHLDGALAGIMMQGDPEPGQQSYSQGYAPPPFDWTDRARVVKLGHRVSNFSGDYNNVLVIEEYNQLEPNSFQLKYYAKGVGNVGIGWAGDDQSKETMDLVEVRFLNKEQMTDARREALALEMRANIYGTTSPALPRNNGNMAKQ